METTVAKGEIIAEGKTKQVIATENGMVLLRSTDDITAGDGAKHDIIAGKAALANRTTCNVFSLLKACGLPVAFEKPADETAFLAPLCRMLPLEVVVRREAHGSYLKRAPWLTKGTVFPKLLVEFFLKTSGKRLQGQDIPCDDPLMVLRGEKSWKLYLPNRPIQEQEPFFSLPYRISEQIFRYPGQAETSFSEMAKIARHTFLILEKAWQLLGCRLVDFKVEFGFDTEGNLLLADVIDNDSWRVVEDGAYIDKQAYRDGADLNEVTAKYRKVADLTDRFSLPRQEIILWRGSDKDDKQAFEKAYEPFMGGDCQLRFVTCSMHKEPVKGLAELATIAQDCPDAVVIAYVGRSNGAGPILAANTHLPVITVPAGYQDFPDDVWSSLRTPSDVPVMTVLEPGNAVLAAIEILALRNPRLYALVRRAKEERMTNTVEI